MANKARIAAAMKNIPGISAGASGWGRVNPAATEMYGASRYRGNYGPFMPRPSEVFSDGAFGPMPPIQPVPVDEPPLGGQYPDPRWWQYRVGWNLPTPPGTEGLKLASFDQLRILASKYSVARACIDLRQQEIRGLDWEITLTKDAAKAYQASHADMKDFGERAAEATKFFRNPDPDYWNFDSFLNALLEEIFVYDALSLIFRPKFGERLGMGGKGLLGSKLDSLRLVSGPTIRPLVDMHGGRPSPPAPAYQQYLYGVPRSDYITMMRGDDIDDYGLTGAEIGEFSQDVMLYAPYWPVRESPYGFPPVERALLPIISGLQKQEFQLDYFSEGSVPAVYISPGDPNITPTQIKELQDALNGIAGDPAYHMKVVVLPPGSKVEPQRPVDLSDSFDELVMEQVCMAFDVQPMEIGIIPNIGGGTQGPSASAIRFAAQEARDIKSRKSTKPMLKWICNIFNTVLQDICGQHDMRFQFEGLADDEDKQAITELGVQQVQNGIASIDEVRDRLDMAPWGLQETSEPVVFTAQGPIPFSMAPQLIMAAAQGNNNSSSSSSKKKGNSGTQSTNSGQRTSSSETKTKQPRVRAGGQTKPNGCLAAETLVVTAKGAYPISDLTGPQRLLTDKGWVDAEIREFGVQELREVVLERHGVQRVIFATPNHRWYLNDGSVKITDNLSVIDDIGFVDELTQPRLGGADRNDAPPGVPGWNIVSVLPTSRVEQVYCAVVPELHRFVLAGGVLTGNSHPAPVSPHRESVTPAHSAARGAIQSPTPRTGGTTSRSSVAGSRKKAIASELDALRRHLRKNKDVIYTWQPKHIDTLTLAKIADDLAMGTLIDIAVERALASYEDYEEVHSSLPEDFHHKLEFIELAAEPEIRKAAQWPGWERDLGLVGAYKNIVADAFHDAEKKGSELRQKAASGDMFVSASTLGSLVQDQLREVFVSALTPLWAEAWHLGYEAGKSLATGKDADFTVKHQSADLDNFIATEGQHWLDEISRTGLVNSRARSEMIARTEVARAMNAAAIQAYRDHGVTHKHLLLAPEDICDICKTARDQGVIPLDAVFPGGGLGGPFHPQCRCVPAPANVTVEPPQAHIRKSDDPSMVAFIMFRSESDGHPVYLLQKRGDDTNNPGTWGLPGGTSHPGEDPWHTAIREVTEEIGDVPECQPAAHLIEHDGDRDVHIFLCDVSPFTPKMNGRTAHETAGWGWFRKKEIKDLPLQPNFEKQWEAVDWKDVAKALSRAVNENGEELLLTRAGQELQASGARWPYPHRADGAEDPHYGQAPTPEPPRWDDFSDRVGEEERIVPRGNDGDYPPKRTRNKPPKKFPDQGGRRWTDTLTGGPQSPVGSVGSSTGVPPSPTKAYTDMLLGKRQPVPVRHQLKPNAGAGRLRPVVGAEGPVTPHPYEPHTEEGYQPFDPELVVPVLTDEGDAYRSPKLKGAGGPSDFSDPNPVDAEHVYLTMSKNFPPDAIDWVKRARWVGPVNIPWNRIDSDDAENWAASHQPEHVKNFERQIKAHDGHVAPSITIQDNDSPKAIIIDGHHRALARKNLGMPVLSYLGMIDPKDRQAAEETHSRQIHSGADPNNK